VRKDFGKSAGQRGDIVASRSKPTPRKNPYPYSYVVRIFFYPKGNHMQLTTRDVMTLSSAIKELRKHYDTLEGKEMSKLELYRVHTVLHAQLQEIGLDPQPIAIYTHPIEVQA